MNKFLALLAASCAVATFTSLVPKAYAESGEPGLAIDMVTSNNVHLQFPYYSESLTTIGEPLKTYLIQDITEVLTYIKEVISDKIDNPNIGRIAASLKWISVTKNLMSMGSAQSERRKSVSKSLGLKGKFNKDMQTMFKKLIGQSSEVEKQLKGTEKQPEQLKKDVNDFIDLLVEGFSNSPVVTYVNWDEGLIDGEKFTDRASNLMGQLRYNGFGTILGLVDQLIKLVVMLSSSSR